MPALPGVSRCFSASGPGPAKKIQFVNEIRLKADHGGNILRYVLKHQIRLH